MATSRRTPHPERAVHQTTAHTTRAGAHHSHSSHVLHRLGDWSAKAEAGATVALILLAWAIFGLATGFQSWWQITLYSTTSAVTVVMCSPSSTRSAGSSW